MEPMMGSQTNPVEASPVALQLWTIREALAADADQALACAKEAGFDAVEVAPLPPDLTAARLDQLLRRHGLAALSVHGDLPTDANIAQWADLARECRCSKLIWHGWPRDPRFDSLAGLRQLIDDCNKAARLASDHRLVFGMHNHWWEFERLEGELPIQIFHERLDPAIFWQLDIYWAQTAGADLGEVIRLLSPRLRSVHWKDGPCVQGQPMTVLGQGAVDLPKTMVALPSGVDWVIELDECATDRLEAARQSRIYLESLVQKLTAGILK